MSTEKTVINPNILNASMEELYLFYRASLAQAASGLSIDEILKAFEKRLSFPIDDITENDFIFANVLFSKTLEARKISDEIRNFFKFSIDEERIFVFNYEIPEASDCPNTLPIKYYITNKGVIEATSDDGMYVSSETTPEALFELFKAERLKGNNYEIDEDTQKILDTYTWINIFLYSYKDRYKTTEFLSKLSYKFPSLAAFLSDKLHFGK